MELTVQVLTDTAWDCLRLLPFLFLTYLFMELLEHGTGSHLEERIKNAGRFGPVIGALCGILPQCGFSAAAASLYTGGIISAGTLIAVFLSTSDELIPVFLSYRTDTGLLVLILLCKLILGMVFGFLVDFIHRQLMRRSFLKGHTETIEEFCEQEHCKCGQGPFLSALRHTMRIFLFLFFILLVLNLLTETIGTEALSGFLNRHDFLALLACGAIGLIPSCAASVFLCEMYLNGILNFGCLMAGLLSGAGVGLLVLFRTNRNEKENLALLGTLYLLGVIGGGLLSFLPIG